MAEGFDLWTTLRLKDEGVEAGLSKVGRAAHGAKESLGGLEKGVKGVEIGVHHLLGLAGIGGLWMTLEKGAHIAAEAEAGMAKLQTRMEDGQDAAAMYGAGITEIGKKYATSGGDLRAGMYDILAAGTAQGDALKVLDAANQMAVGGFSDVKTSVSGLTTVLNAYGLAGDKADYVANTFAVTQKRSKATIGELSVAVQELAKPGALSHVAFEDLSASLAVATRNGINLGTATGGLHGILNSLATGGGRAAAMLQKAGVTDWGKASIETRGFVGTLAYLNEKLGGNAAMMKRALGSTEGYTLAMELLGSKGRKEFDSLTTEIHTHTGALAHDVETMENTVEHKLAKMELSFKRALGALGAGFFDAVGLKSGDTEEKVVHFAETAGKAIGDFFKDFDYYSTQAERLLGILLAYKGAAAATAFIGGLSMATGAAAAGGGAGAAAARGGLARGVGGVLSVAVVAVGAYEAGKFFSDLFDKMGRESVGNAMTSTANATSLSWIEDHGTEEERYAAHAARMETLKKKGAATDAFNNEGFSVGFGRKWYPSEMLPRTTTRNQRLQETLDAIGAGEMELYRSKADEAHRHTAAMGELASRGLPAIANAAREAAPTLWNAGQKWLESVEQKIKLMVDITQTTKDDKDKLGPASIKARIDRGEGEARLVSPEFRMTLVREGAGGLVVHPLEDHVIDLAMLGGRS